MTSRLGLLRLEDEGADRVDDHLEEGYMNRPQDQRQAEGQRNERESGNGNMNRENERHRLAQIVVDAPAQPDGVDDGCEVVVEEDNGGGFARDVGAAPAHRHADVGCFSDGASLTPSPVIATTSPSALRACTMRSFCSGMMRAKTLTARTAAVTSASLIAASSSPVTARPALFPLRARWRGPSAGNRR